MAFRIPISLRPAFKLRKDRTDLATAYLMEVIAGKTAVRDTGCWEWTGWHNVENGYGHFKIGGKIYRVHRLVYECCEEDIPKGKLVLHDCPGGDNPRCCNPGHLWLGDERANIIDCVKKGRHPSAILTPEAVREIRRDTSIPSSRNYQHYKYLSRKHKVSVESIKGVVYGKTWGHIGDGHGSGGPEPSGDDD